MKSSLLVDELKTGDSPMDETSVPQFYIAASASMQERRTRTLKHGDTFAVFDHRGDIGARFGSSEGSVPPRYSHSVAVDICCSKKRVRCC